MKLMTLFSGIGAPEQASKRVWKKVKFVAACEIDKFAGKSFEAMYNPDEEHFHSDINNLDGTKYKGKIDLLVGGSPCQSFSIAGMRKGLDDNRGQLIYQFVRVLEEVKPKVFLYENVKGFLSIDKGESIKQFMLELENAGYHLHHKVLNTRHYGVPQNRERIFIVGFRKKKHYGKFVFPNQIPLTVKLRDILETEVEDKYYLTNKAINYMNRDTGDGVCICASRGRNVDNQGSKVEQRLEINTTGTSNAITTVQKDNYVLEHKLLRKLTPKECWRLQDFPDTAIEKCQKAGLSNSQLYKQAGNSMSVNVIEALMRQIKRSIK